MDESWGRLRERGFLATLLAHPGRPVPVDTLLEWVWPRDAPLPQYPAQTFYTYATRIRKSLQRLDSPPKLRAANGGYVLEVDKSEIDYQRFRELSAAARAEARQRDPHRTVELVEQALPLWRGRPLADLASARADAWRDQFVHNIWLPANVALLDALVATDRLDDALERLDELQSEHPHDLRLAMLRLSVLHGVTRADDAAAYHLGMRRHFRAEANESAAEHLLAHYNSLVMQNRDTVYSAVPVVAPRQLPHDLADFAGREDLLAALDAATTTAGGKATSGVVILDGIAGVGKTALAVRWGYRARQRFPDGELFVNLKGFADAARIEQSTVVDDFLIALGQEPDATTVRRSKELLLSRVLASRRMLVILDNAGEHAQVDGLVRLLSSCLVLITSRRRLGTLAAATGARRVRVEPMTHEEGDDLLAMRLGGRTQMDPERRVRLVELCGGLPLAITLLADHLTRAPAAELSGYVDQLDRRQLLTDVGEHGDGAATVRAFFSHSYLALAPAERRLFRLLGLHPGPDISIDAACACDGRTRAKTNESLNALLSMHLLEQPRALDRFDFHDLIGEFADECAALDELPETRNVTRERIVAFYLASARNAAATLYPGQPMAPALASAPDIPSMSFADGPAARSWFDRERTNLIAAVNLAADHGMDEYTWRLTDPVATYFDRRGYLDDSKAIRRLAVAAARAASHRTGEASSLVGLGMVEVSLGEHTEARRCLDAALRLVEDEGDERGVASTLHQLGRLELVRGDAPAALELYLRSLDVATGIDDHEALCWIHRSLGEAYRHVEQYDTALVHLREAGHLAQRIGEQSAYGGSLVDIGIIYRDLGNVNDAVAHCERALSVVEDIDLEMTARACIALAEINGDRGVPAAAVEHARRAIELCRETRSVTDEARAREVLGDAYHADANLPEAVVAWQLAADLNVRIGNGSRAAIVQAKIDNVPVREPRLPEARPGQRSVEGPLADRAVSPHIKDHPIV
ncbi:MAG: tetratricopeptide repeat protein [Actinophytocola sp.]|uniref:AfsR/SARP family transcriptional regulator n=1 Tax=Actinophytocola sp. TaxID=1872138 RepID=UPI00132AE94E|nr:tetratricopeptide repeat protein [Actinophytocola sp.]MPZ79835.1 tetratricopeptide repeat protein [Actinophytocola sp.]